jgi:hypothetical protein
LIDPSLLVVFTSGSPLKNVSTDDDEMFFDGM